jgi:ATP-binding protein involved in chromosome partitioning
VTDRTESELPEGPGSATTGAVAAALRQALTEVIDPELGDNIVELGMLQGVRVTEGGAVTVDLALTTIGCPLRNQLETEVKRVSQGLAGVTSVRISVSEMSKEGKARAMSRARWLSQQHSPPGTLAAGTRIVAISSGKGGVGKSSVTANLAAALAGQGLQVGVLDADIAGFSIPHMLGLTGQITVETAPVPEAPFVGGHPGAGSAVADEVRASPKMIPVAKSFGAGSVRVLSMGFLSEKDQAIMWRGLMLNRAVQHFLEDANWGDIDLLLIDMPPGTGDVAMGLARMLPSAQVVIVTTPALAAQQVAARAADMARKSHLRVLGVVENMSSFRCDHGKDYQVFGSGGGDRLAASIGAPLLGRIPLEAVVSAGGDSGQPASLGSGPAAEAFGRLAEALLAAMPPAEALTGCSARIFDRVESALTAKDAAAAGRDPAAAAAGSVPESATRR